MVVKHWWIKKLKIWADLKNGFDIFDSTKIRSLNDGGQNFFEKIRTKIRTFSEKIRTIRTIRTIFEKNPYNPNNFRKKTVQFVIFF